MKKHRKDCLIEFHDGEVIQGEMTNDGLVFIFPPSVYLIQKLDSLFVHDDHGWFFNATKDRYIAEWEYQEIGVNPQFVWNHTKECVVE